MRIAWVHHDFSDLLAKLGSLFTEKRHKFLGFQAIKPRLVHVNPQLSQRLIARSVFLVFLEDLPQSLKQLVSPVHALPQLNYSQIK